MCSPKNKTDESSPPLSSLLSLVSTLREQCPWDRKQTPRTSIVYLIEEVHELLSAITANDTYNIVEELGDTLFILFFLVHMYEEQGAFSLSDVINTILEKMIRRHPHVFDKAENLTSREIEDNWDIIKTGEKNGKRTSVLDSVPKGLPSLQRAHMISEKVGKEGFDWDDMEGVIKKVEEEWGEFFTAMNQENKDQVAMEFGDLLFTLTNIARFAGIHPETALSRSVHKFETRYRHMEKALYHLNQSLSDLSPDEKDLLWEEAKKKTRNGDH